MNDRKFLLVYRWLTWTVCEVIDFGTGPRLQSVGPGCMTPDEAIKAAGYALPAGTVFSLPLTVIPEST